MAIQCTRLIISCVVIGLVYGKMDTETTEYEMDIGNSHRHRPIDVYRIYRDDNGPKDQNGYGHGCDRTMTMLTCKTIPKEIPPGVTNVLVTWQDYAIPENQFVHKSWAHVDSLYIHGDNFNLRMGNLFKGLFNLTTLFLNGTDLDRYDRSCFAGLDSLKNLTLTGMDTLDGSSLKSSLTQDKMLPKLDSFALNPGETIRSPFLKVDSQFSRSLAAKEMHCLNFSNIIYETNPWDTIQYFLLAHNLNVLNLTGSFVIIDNSSNERYFHNLNYTFNKPPINIWDTSGLRSTYVASDSNSEKMYTSAESNNRLRKHYVDPVFLYAETWYANYVYTSRTDIHGIYDFSTNQVFMKKLVSTGNNIANLNVTCILPPNNTVLHYDFSNNKLGYIGKGMFVTTFALQELLLSNNQLFHMEHLLEFGEILENLKDLRIFDLASNNISFIPKKMFVSNTRLEILLLANNRLRSITFDFGNLKKLRQLDIRGNMIKFLDKNELNIVQMFVDERHGQLDIRFQGNPIECSCVTQRFVSWLVTLRHITKETIECSYEGDTIDINDDAVGKCNYLCKKTIIISVSITCSLIVAVMILCAFIKIKRMRERKKMKNVELVLKESIQSGNYVCFAAMSGNDEDLVTRVILKTLRRYLQGKVNLDRDVVCTGNRFKPGFSICEESYRLLKMSHVFIAVVSDAFLRSQYCRLELQEACKQDKPTILIFLGRVDTEDMPQYMQEVFRRNSRAWIKQNNEGYYYVVPSLREIGDAIWDLAIADLIKSR